MIEFHDTFLGIGFESWQTVEKGTTFFSQDEESLTGQILSKKKRILASLEFADGGVLIVNFLTRNKNGEYDPKKLTYSQDEIGDVNKILRNGILFPQLRRRIQNKPKHF